MKQIMLLIWYSKIQNLSNEIGIIPFKLLVCVFLLRSCKPTLNPFGKKKINFYFIHIFLLHNVCFYKFAHLFSCKRCESPAYLNLITAIVIVRCLLHHFRHPTNIQNNKKKITGTLNDFHICAVQEMGWKKRGAQKIPTTFRNQQSKWLSFSNALHTCEFHQTQCHKIDNGINGSTTPKQTQKYMYMPPMTGWARMKKLNGAR